MKGNIFGVEHAVTRMLTRDLFTIANVPVSILRYGVPLLLVC